MAKLFKISATLVCPTDWDVAKVRDFLRRQILTTDQEMNHLVIVPVTAVDGDVDTAHHGNTPSEESLAVARAILAPHFEQRELGWTELAEKVARALDEAKGGLG